MKSPLIHILGALAIGLIALGGYGAWYAAVSAESRHVADLQSQIDDANKNVDSIAAARAALAEIADDEATVRSYFVSDTGVVSFINNLEQMGTLQASHLSVLSVATAGSSTQPVLLLTLSITGTFDAVMRTVGLVEYAPYDLFISKLAVAQQDKGSWQANLSVTVGSVPTLPVASSTAQKKKL
jgi:hypothetical protein